MSSNDIVQKRLQQSFAVLQQYFSLSRKQEGIGNVAQLVLFAEHAAKVLLIPIKAHRKQSQCTEWMRVCCMGELGALLQFRASH